MKTFREDRFVVKGQVPLDGDGPVFVYNKDRSIKELFEGDVVAEMCKLLRGKPKGFFYAHIDNERLALDDPAPWQTW